MSRAPSKSLGATWWQHLRCQTELPPLRQELSDAKAELWRKPSFAGAGRGQRHHYKPGSQAGSQAARQDQAGIQTAGQLAKHEAGLARSEGLTVSISQHTANMQSAFGQSGSHRASIARSQGLTVNISQHTVNIQSTLSQHSSQHVISLG